MTMVQAPPRAALRRLTGLRHTSPGRLQLLLVTLLALTALTGLVAGVTASAAATGTADLRDRAQPLMSEAQTVYSSLADADTTAARAFITGGLEPAVLTRRYEDDLERAAAALTSAARRVPADGRAGEAIQRIATGLTRYTALIASARTLNRQGKPVGAAYLSTASQLNRETLQPQAQLLFQEARRAADSGYDDAEASWWLMLLVVLFVGLAVALVWTQIYLSRSTNRLFNVPLLAASGVAVLLVIGCVVVFGHQRGQLVAADRDGSAPLEVLAEKRILVLRERADEALTLAARAGHGPLEEEFRQLSERVTFDDPQLDDMPALMREAADLHGEFLTSHRQVRSLDDGGDYEGAVELAASDDMAQTFDRLTATLDRAMDDRRAAFGSRIKAAGSGLGALIVLGPLLALVIGVLATIGLRARLEEYR
ncbi:hypothetical protein Aca07nite_52770 [Actinoplanes capillaceus]|uniref:Secreted protein n=2 Tax=Actinoplanes campanulatus TaxID=113559 RepID=A0ABQ3WP55_9ACTN|nr:hypothetical protein Aca07nite_52770 [Actinoplanes capillaceus]